MSTTYRMHGKRSPISLASLFIENFKTIVAVHKG